MAASDIDSTSFQSPVADGLIIEVHENPQCAWSDGAQSLKPHKFTELIQKGRTIAQVIGRDIA